MMPTSEMTIWHYVDLAKYVGILSRGLFFARPSVLRLSDPWEGSCGELDFVDSLDATVHASPEGVAKWQAALRFRQQKQDEYGISCWHASESESAALWRLYTSLGHGVAIRSTVGRVRAATLGRPLELREIDYKGHHGRRLGDDPISLLSTKRPEFKHEAEVRFLARLSADETNVLNVFYSQIEKHGVRRIKPGNKAPHVQVMPGVAVQDASCLERGAPAGMHLQTDLSVLIDKVRLAPGCSYPLRRAVIDITKRFGLPKRVVTEAQQGLAPFDQVEFD